MQLFASRPTAWAGCLLLGWAVSCRNAPSEALSASGGAPIVPAIFGTNGCNAPNQVFTAPQLPSAVALATLQIGPLSQIAGAADGELLYATGDNATLVALDFGAGLVPVETELLAPGTVDTLLLTLGQPGPAVLSGLAVLDDEHLVVMEHSAHLVLLVSRSTPNELLPLAGLASPSGGFADGVDALARFHFGDPGQLCPTGDGRIFVADTGNHAIRVLFGGLVTTIAGSGSPAYADGSLAATLFDTPAGLAVTCNNQLLIAETGAFGSGGHRLRQLEIGQLTFFGQLGASSTLVGSGTPASAAGNDTLAQVFAPFAPVVTAEGELYWIDLGTGVLRRRLVSGACDCPLESDCTAAVLAPSFTVGGLTSLALSASGVLYALDASAGLLYRITP